MSDYSATEHRRLEDIAGDSWYAKGVNGASVAYSGEIFARHFRGGACLELGPAEGVMTELLDGAFDSLTVVDGSERFCESLRERFPRAEVIHSLFEEFEPGREFDAIVLGHVLEHVADSRQMLAGARDLLTPAMLGDEHELNEQDIHHGHRRVYDPESFRHDFLAAGLEVEVFGGYWIKPLSNAQIDASWTPEMIRAFMALGERYPDIAAEIYVIAGR
jgi:ubiquinone/menaquinone biosynthesis C-methylase UbiE